MEDGGTPATTAEPTPEQSVPEHAAAPAADLFPFSSATPAVVVVTVDAPAAAEAEATTPSAKAPYVFKPSGSSKVAPAALEAKHVEVRPAALQQRHGCGAAAGAARCGRVAVRAARRHSMRLTPPAPVHARQSEEDQHRRNAKANLMRKPRAQSVFARPFQQARGVARCLLARRGVDPRRPRSSP